MYCIHTDQNDFSSLIFFQLLESQPRATFKFPLGEISLEEKDEEEEQQKRALSLNGIVKSHILNGVYTARFSDENLDLRYAYKVISFGIVSLTNLLSFYFFHFVKKFIVMN